jgi:hypothetical protein
MVRIQSLLSSALLEIQAKRDWLLGVEISSIQPTGCIDEKPYTDTAQKMRKDEAHSLIRRAVEDELVVEVQHGFDVVLHWAVGHAVSKRAEFGLLYHAMFGESGRRTATESDGIRKSIVVSRLLAFKLTKAPLPKAATREHARNIISRAVASGVVAESKRVGSEPFLRWAMRNAQGQNDEFRLLGRVMSEARVVQHASANGGILKSIVVSRLLDLISNSPGAPFTLTAPPDCQRPTRLADGRDLILRAVESHILTEVIVGSDVVLYWTAAGNTRTAITDSAEFRIIHQVMHEETMIRRANATGGIRKSLVCSRLRELLPASLPQLSSVEDTSPSQIRCSDNSEMEDWSECSGAEVGSSSFCREKSQSCEPGPLCWDTRHSMTGVGTRTESTSRAHRNRVVDESLSSACSTVELMDQKTVLHGMGLAPLKNEANDTKRPDTGNTSSALAVDCSLPGAEYHTAEPKLKQFWIDESNGVISPPVRNEAQPNSENERSPMAKTTGKVFDEAPSIDQSAARAMDEIQKMVRLREEIQKLLASGEAPSCMHARNARLSTVLINLILFVLGIAVGVLLAVVLELS